MSLKSRKHCISVILIGFFLLILQKSEAQQDFSSLDAFFKKYQKDLGGDAVSIIMKNGKVLYQKEVGEFNVKTQAPIASCSKWLTAAMVMTLVDEGKIHLDDPVANYIPIFNKYMKSYVTIRHCLTHTTGIERESKLIKKIVERSNYQNLEEEVNAIAAKEISNNPGVEFFYGGVGLNIAARVCEIVTKKSFDRLVQEKILRPLKMRSTNFTNDNGGAPNPSGGAKSTALDYMNFLQMLLNKGTFEGKKVLSPESVEMMLKVQTAGFPVKYAPPAAGNALYGFGAWILDQDENGNGIVVACPGLFGTWPYIDRKRNYAAIVFVKNLQASQRRQIMDDFQSRVEGILDSQ
ncbi:MAG: beta-lactamase family protein [Chitinophagaceae bacterium]|uniref:serine hydrolase domain-containing protein n=1 Tax=unclassified Paraflavitalea TaxID=2798305 RepID=UPI003D337133|nr:beta-lactamase family protein [Chitinophagaceae bacterium]